MIAFKENWSPVTKKMCVGGRGLLTVGRKRLPTTIFFSVFQIMEILSSFLWSVGREVLRFPEPAGILGAKNVRNTYHGRDKT